MTYETKQMPHEVAMNAPTAKHFEDGKFYISSCWIPQTYTEAAKVYFVSDTEGGEYGQFPTLRQAIDRLNNI